MTTPVKPATNSEAARSVSVPALEPGDRLTAAEFERRYDAMPELKKAELIEGFVYMPSPIRYRQHGRPELMLGTWLAHYELRTPGVAAVTNATVRLDQDNEPQPDALLRIEAECGGQTRISDDDYIEGPPELIAEVASSSVSIDLHTKRHVYRRSGVREYVVWRVLDREIDWFILREGNYDRLRPADDGLLKSEVFPGLWLDAAALLGGDLQTVLATLNRGVQSPEHTAFVRRLSQATKP